MVDFLHDSLKCTTENILCIASLPGMRHDALKGCRPRAVHAVKPLLGYPELRPAFHKRTSGVLNACLLDRTVWEQCIIFQPETRIIRRGRLGSSATNRRASGFAFSWQRYKVIGALPCPAKKGSDPTVIWTSARNGVDWTSPSCRILSTRCAHNTQVHLLQALAKKRARASMSGHSSLVALCSLVLSQGGQ